MFRPRTRHPERLVRTASKRTGEIRLTFIPAGCPVPADVVELAR